VKKPSPSSRSSCPNSYLAGFAPTPREMTRRYASRSGRRRWSLLHMRTTAVKSFFHYCTVLSLTHDPVLFFPSVLSSRDSRHLDCRFFRIHSVHGLVAGQLTRDPELVAGTASLFRSSCTHHVLHRLVMPPTTFIFPLVLALKRERFLPPIE